MTNQSDQITEFFKSPVEVEGKLYKKSDFEQERIPFEVSRHHKNDLTFDHLEGQEKQAFILKIPDNKVIKEPVILKYKPTRKNLRFGLVIQVGKNSEVTILEDMSKMIESEIVVSRQWLVVGQNSKFRQVRIQNVFKKTHLIDDRYSKVKEGAVSSFIDFHFGAKSVSNSVKQICLSENSVVNTDIIGRCINDQSYRFDCEHNHLSPNTKGRILMKGVALDKARISSKGSIFIDQKGKGTETYMQQDSLNLGPNSVINSTPELRIDTNDVKASHGSSIRNLSKEELFYLNSRGLDADSSRKMLMTGFLKEELSKVKEVAGAYEWVKRLI